MPWLIFALGLALAAAGGMAVVHGYDYIRTDFGGQEMIAGTTALSGGIVTIAIGAVLVSLRTLRRSVERGNAMRSAPSIEAAPVTPAAAPEPAIVTPVSAPATVDAASPVEEPGTVEAPKPEKPRDRSSARPLSALRSARVPPPPPAPSQSSTPAVAGRYESGGSSYVLFTDGTIEVESESGKRRFASMDELKGFMAQEQPDGVGAEQAR